MTIWAWSMFVLCGLLASVPITKEVTKDNIDGYILLFDFNLGLWIWALVSGTWVDILITSILLPCVVASAICERRAYMRYKTWYTRWLKGELRSDDPRP